MQDYCLIDGVLHCKEELLQKIKKTDEQERWMQLPTVSKETPMHLLVKVYLYLKMCKARNKLKNELEVVDRLRQDSREKLLKAMLEQEQLSKLP